MTTLDEANKHKEVLYMHKTTAIKTDRRITVDINGLQTMLSVGKNTAAAIGEQAGAVIHVGRRKLFNVAKVEHYVNTLAESGL